MPYKMGVAPALMCVWFANFSSYKSELLCSGWSTTSGVSQFFKFGSAIAWLDAKTAVVNLKATPFSLSMKTILTLRNVFKQSSRKSHIICLQKTEFSHHIRLLDDSFHKIQTTTWLGILVPVPERVKILRQRLISCSFLCAKYCWIVTATMAKLWFRDMRWLHRLFFVETGASELRVNFFCTHTQRMDCQKIIQYPWNWTKTHLKYS